MTNAEKWLKKANYTNIWKLSGEITVAVYTAEDRTSLEQIILDYFNAEVSND